MKHSLPLLIAFMMVIGCKPTVPSQYIQPDDMEDMLYDYHMAEAMAKLDFGEESAMRRQVYFQSVLQKHHVTEADFDSSLVYYYSHLDRLKDIYGRVNERLAEEARRMGTSLGDIGQYSQYSAEGDTANIWTGLADFVLVPNPTRNRFDFTVKGDSTFLRGDAFMFQFLSESIAQNGMPAAVVYLCAQYQDSTFRQVYTHTSSAEITQLNLPAYDNSSLKELRGFIYLPNGEPNEARRLMFVSQIQLIRFHNKNIAQQAETDENIPTDSVQRVDNTRGAAADTASGPVGTGLRSKRSPFRKGGGAN